MFTRNRSLRRRSREVVEASVAPCVEELERRQMLSNAPNAPFGLAATAVSSTTVNLSFYDSATNETGFVIQKAVSPGGSFSTVTTLPAAAGSGTKVTFSDTSDVGSTTYTYKVYAVNGIYQSSAPTIQVTTPSGAPPAPPAAPSNVSAALSGSNILVSFTDNSNNETDFQILRSTSQNGTYTSIGMVSGDASTGGTKQFTDKTAQAGQTYFYEVFAENSGGPSSTVGPTSGVTVPVPTPPAAPSNLSAALSGNSVVVTFTDNSNNENDFVVQRSTNPSSGFATVGTVNGDAATGTKTFTDNGVAANTTYYYQVYSENGAGPSAIVGPSNGVTTPQNSGTNPGGPPNGPYVFSATPVSAGQVNLAFYDSATNETGFVIQRSTSSSGPFANIATLPPNPGSGNKITYTDTTTTGSTTYFYKVFAVNGPYTSGVANTSCTTPAGATAPAAPSNLGAALSGTNVLITFTDNSTTETDFKLLRSTNAAGPFTTVVATIPGDAATGAKQYTDTTVAPGTTYYYEIYAENAVGPSTTVGPTGGVTTPPAATAPADPSNIGAALSGKNVVVSFTDNSTNETDFQILRSTTQNGTYTQVGTVSGDAITGSKQFTDTTVAAGGTYYYEVFAENGVGPSNTVGPTSGVTTPVPPADPSNLGASLSGNSIVISFSDNSTNETDFVIERSTSAGGTFSAIKTIAGDATTGTKQYTDNTVLAGTTYYYEVFAENAAGPSDVIGPTAGVTTPSVPNAPTNLNVSLSGTSIVVSFTDNSTDENDFQVLRSTNPSSGFVSVQTITGDAATGTKQWTDNTVSQGVTYYYEVFAENNVGPSTTLGPSSGVTVPNNGNAPAAPTGLLATVEGLHIGISFNDVSNNESDFQIQRSTSPSGGFSTVGTIAGDTSTGIQLFTDLGVSVGTTYYYRVIAENGGGQVIVGPTAGVVPVDTNGIAPGTNPGGPPNGPYGLTANAINSGSVQIQFVDNSTNETGFVILRATSSGGPYTQIGTMPPFANSHVLQSYVDIGVSPNTTYYYKVYAVNGPYSSNTAGPASAAVPAAGNVTPAGPWVPYAKLIQLDKERVDFPQINGSGVTVAMMDRGVDYNAPGLSAGKIIGGFNFRDNNTNLLDDYGHGTGVAGIIAASGYNYNGNYNEGVATGANLVVMKQESSANIKNALDWLIANAAKYNVQVLNLTDFVTDVNSGAWNPTVYNSELQTLWNMGIFICSPVGNGEILYGPNAPITYPSLSPYVVGVGGVNQDGTMYADSLRGNGLDVLGPANNVTMPYYVKNPNDPGYSQFDDQYDGTGAIVNYAIGTSWASAYTAGVAALIKQVNQKITPDEILSILKQSGTQVADPENAGVSYPMINADKAVAMAESLYGPNGTSTP